MPQLLQIDAFTDRPFSGNPAAVCLLDAPADATWMQRVAAEMNLAETAFLVPQGDHFGLRWFTPTVEVELCGHATLASAHALWQVGRVPAGTTSAEMIGVVDIFATLAAVVGETRLDPATIAPDSYNVLEAFTGRRERATTPQPPSEAAASDSVPARKARRWLSMPAPPGHARRAAGSPSARAPWGWSGPTASRAAAPISAGAPVP